ncbi:MAG: HNH endonuclease [Caldilinea sp.]|nr:HNH endonuclease [Caldilinea sp.]
MVAQGVRDAVRHNFQYRCGYCGVQEDETGSLLEIDHYQPRSTGGGDELDNLVYCCSNCNRRKGDFWPTDGMSARLRILHPQKDDLSQHLQLQLDGSVVGLAETGRFHIERLQLNRPPLLALRRVRQDVQLIRQGLLEAQEERTRLEQRIQTLSKSLEEVLDELSRLSGA